MYRLFGWIFGIIGLLLMFNVIHVQEDQKLIVLTALILGMVNFNKADIEDLKKEIHKDDIDL